MRDREPFKLVRSAAGASRGAAGAARWAMVRDIGDGQSNFVDVQFVTGNDVDGWANDGAAEPVHVLPGTLSGHYEVFEVQGSQIEPALLVRVEQFADGTWYAFQGPIREELPVIPSSMTISDCNPLT